MLCLSSNIPWVAAVVVIWTKSICPTEKSVPLSHCSVDHKVLRRGGLVCRRTFHRYNGIFLGLLRHWWIIALGDFGWKTYSHMTCEITVCNAQVFEWICKRALLRWIQLARSAWQDVHLHLPTSAGAPLGRALPKHPQVWQPLGRSLLDINSLSALSCLWSHEFYHWLLIEY